MNTIKKTQRILIVTPYLARAGVGMVVNNLVNSIQKFNKDINIDIIDLCNESIDSKDYGLYNVNIYYVERLKTSGITKFKSAISNIIKKGNYDVVHIHTDLLCWVVAQCAKKNNIPIIVGHAHGQEFQHYPKIFVKLIKKPCQYLNRKYCTDWIGCSKESLKHMFGKEGILVPNYVSYDKLKYLNQEEILIQKKELEINENKIIIGYAGRLNSIKNAIFIPEIYKNEEMDGFQSMFCGGYYEETQSKFKEYALEDKAVFLGLRDDMDRLYNLFDIYICPSISEGMSMSLIQSQMMGIPCVVSKGVPKINDLGLGLFIQCETYDTKEWKDNIDKASTLIGSKSKEEIKAIMKQNKLDEESIINKIMTIYNYKL